MKHLLIIFLCLTCAVIAYAKHHCQGFNNYDNKVTIVFTDNAPTGHYEVTDVKLTPCYGKELSAASVKTEIRDGVATVTLTFPHHTQFSNPRVTLRVNGKKAKFKVCQ